MTTPTLITLILFGSLAVVVFWVIAIYNNLTTLKNRKDEAWSDIDVQLKRRYDLIPNLLETVKGYASHESQTFQKVTEARTAAMNAGSTHEKAEAENMLTQTLKSLFAVSENYPDLKASQNFLQMQDDLKDAEDKIQAARRFFNANVRDFNTKIQVFPNNIIAGKMKFEADEFFEIEEKHRENPQVKF